MNHKPAPRVEAFAIRAYNACYAINPDNPMAVVKALPLMVEALKGAHGLARNILRNYPGNCPQGTCEKIGRALAALDAKEETPK